MLSSTELPTEGEEPPRLNSLTSMSVSLTGLAVNHRAAGGLWVDDILQGARVNAENCRDQTIILNAQKRVNSMTDFNHVSGFQHGILLAAEQVFRVDPMLLAVARHGDGTRIPTPRVLRRQQRFGQG